MFSSHSKKKKPNQPLASPSPSTNNQAAAYTKKKASVAAKDRSRSVAGRDIAPLPEVKRPDVKEACRFNFELFCLSYFPHIFVLPFCQDQKDAAKKIQITVLVGGQYALAMPRGTGKTSLCEVGAIFAAAYGHRKFVLFLGNSAERAVDSLDSIKKELETNELLQGDFPEVCHGIAKLERISNRCKGQTFEKRPTYIVWDADEIIFPTIPGSPASGAIIKVAGLTSSIRGMKRKRPSDKKSVRPDLVIPDDVQTEESAQSPQQCKKRLKILSGAVLGLAGPKKKIAVILLATVIEPGDLADEILDRDLHPEWQGERKKMVYAFPKNEKLWSEYAEIRVTELRAGRGLEAATQFYQQNQAAMDEGAQVAWAERFNDDEASAVQHAMNLKLANEEAFESDYQNNPKKKTLGDIRELTAAEIICRLNRHARGVVEAGTSFVTCGIDVQKGALFWLVAGWDANFGGSIVDYGVWPAIDRRYYTLADVQKKTEADVAARGLEAWIYGALDKLTHHLLGMDWKRDDSTPFRVNQCLIDANWGDSTPVVYKFCRESVYRAVVMPSHGRGVGAKNTPFADYRPEPGARVGLNWRIPPAAPTKPTRYVIFDANFFKSFVHGRLAVGMGAKGVLTLFGESERDHEMLADHLTAEYRTRTFGRGREVDEWQMLPSRRDNHWFDCLVLAAVAASMAGAGLEAHGVSGQPVQRKKVSFAEMQAEAKGRRVG